MANFGCIWPLEGQNNWWFPDNLVHVCISISYIFVKKMKPYGWEMQATGVNDQRNLQWTKDPPYPVKDTTIALGLVLRQFHKISSQSFNIKESQGETQACIQNQNRALQSQGLKKTGINWEQTGGAQLQHYQEPYAGTLCSLYHWFWDNG